MFVASRRLCGCSSAPLLKSSSPNTSSKRPRNYWKDKANQRQFLEGLRAQLGLQSVSEWSTVPTTKVLQHGGSFILRHYPSFEGALKEIYPEENWNTYISQRRYSLNFWRSEANVKKFLDDLAEKLSLQKEEDWFQVSSRTIKDNGGAGLLQVYSSLFDILTDVYPEKDWWKSGLQHKIPRKFWNLPANQRKFMDKLSKKLDITHISQWRAVSANEIEHYGGGRLLEIYPTTFDLLSTVYPEYEWSSFSYRNFVPLQIEEHENTTNKLIKENLDDHINTMNQKQQQQEEEKKKQETKTRTTTTTTKKNDDPHGLNMSVISTSELQEGLEKENRLIPPVLIPHRAKQRQWMDELAIELNIQSHNDWVPLTMDVVIEHEGYDIAKEYPTLSVALRKLYPEFQWTKLPQIRQMPHEFWMNHWKNIDNQREFLNQLQNKLNIQTPKEWSYVSESQLKDHGGYGILFFHASLNRALKELFPDKNWSSLPSKQQSISHWRDPKYQRAFLDQVAAALNISSPEEWASVTLQQIKAHGGAKLLLHYSSLREALKTLYSSQKINWDEIFSAQRIPRNYFLKMANRKQFLDQISKKLNISQASDWSTVSGKCFRKQGGGPLLRLYPSLYAMLRDIYPEQNWDFFIDDENVSAENYCKDLTINYYWNDPANVKSFVDYFAKKNDIELKEEWYDVSDNSISNFRGGVTLLQKYGSLINILQIAYPDENWDPDLFSCSGKPSKRQRLFNQLVKLFPNDKIVRKFSNNDIRLNDKKIKFFCCIPSVKLLIKYYSQADYKSISLEDYDKQNKQIINICDSKGYKIVVIDPSHDWSPSALRKLITSEYPSLESSIVNTS